MTAPQPPAPEVSDDELVRQFTVFTIGFAGALVLVLAIGVLYLVPGGSVRSTGAVIGVVLALVSWFGSRGVTGFAAANAVRSRRARQVTASGTELGATGLARTIAFIGIGVAEAPALLGLVLAVGSDGDTGPFVIAIPVAVAAIVLNASGPPAMRRHLERLRG